MNIFSLKGGSCIGILLLAMACGAPKNPVQPDVAHGHIGKAEWPDCRLNTTTGTVSCDCNVFVMVVKADGTTVMRCPK